MNIEEADIVRMTREAGGFDATPVFLKRFAERVAAHEREECAKIIDKRLSNWASLAGKDKAYKWLEKLANAIRARGKA
jgi:hypothetical protein